MLDRFTSSSKWRLDMKQVFRPGVLCIYTWLEIHVESNGSWIDISKVFKVIMRKKENCLESTTFSNYTKINWRLRWR